MMKREKLKKKHWLLIEILIVVLIVIVLLNIVRIPVMHTEQYTEQQPMMVNGTATQQVPYNLTTCTTRDYAFSITRAGVARSGFQTNEFDYQLKNKESKSGTFRYRLGMATLASASAAQLARQQ